MIDAAEGATVTGLHVENAIDLHCHFAPDTLGGKSIERGIDLRTGITAVQSAKDAVESGQAGVVLKSHTFASTAVASAIADMFPGLRVFGAICTDFPTGGLNVSAVAAALLMGAKIVWLPTVNSAHDHANKNVAGFDGAGIRVTDDAGNPTAAVEEIAELVRQHDAVLATGHISADEHYSIVSHFAPRGKVVVTHAAEELSGPNLSKAQCVELADLGATVEFTALRCTGVMPGQGKSPMDTAEFIAAVGYQRCVLSTDYGFLKHIPRPVPGFKNFLESMWSEGGVAESVLAAMASEKPAELLGIQL